MPNLSQRAKAGTKGTANAGADARRKKTKKRGKRSAAAVSDVAAKAARGDRGNRIFADSPRMLLHRVRLGLGTSIDLHTAVIAIVEMMRDRLIRLSEQATKLPPAPPE